MRELLLAATILGSGLVVGLVTSSTARAETVVVTADRMIDVLAGKIVEQPVIVITDGRIASVTSGGSVPTMIPAGAARVDLPGKMILPGLIDMHVHVDADDDQRLSRARIGYIGGPRIVPATYAVGSTGGHCDNSEGLPPSFAGLPQPAVIGGPEAARKMVRTLQKYGAEVIKICATGGVLSRTDAAGAQQLTYDEMKAIADEAHVLGLSVAAHAHGTSGINDALRAGVDTIEHASLADEESFRLAKERGAWFSMDIYDDDYILAKGAKNGVHEDSLAKERAIGRKQRETFHAAARAGVKQVFGTDNGGVFSAGQNALQFACHQGRQSG
jgi:imidazolonepropionase-like amidohydrolase